MNSDDLRTFFPQFHRILRDAQMRSALLPRLTEEEIEAIEKLLPAVIRETIRWSELYSPLSQESILPAAVGAIIQLPRLPVQAVATRTKANIWLPAFDDLLDRQALSAGEIEDVLQECLAVACQPRSAVATRSPFGMALADIVEELAQYPLWRELHPCWTVSLVQVLEASMYEYWLQRRASGWEGQMGGFSPLFDEYLFYGRRSIGITYLWISSLILENDRSALPVLSQLIALADQCALVVRLANDLATYERESREGKVNSITILANTLRERDPDMDGESALKHARDQINERLELEFAEASRMTARIRTDSAIEHRFLRATEFGVELYRRRDFRTWAHGLFADASSNYRS